MNKYILDLEKIFEFVSKDDTKEVEEVEITDGYNLIGDNSDEEKNVSKVIRELKTKGATQRDSLRYDLVKMLLAEVFSANVEDVATYGTIIALDTLKNYDMIIEE